jgi:hypothetical protein
MSTFDNSVDRKYPPIGWMATGALVLIIVGGIMTAAYAPRKAPMGVSATLLVLGAALLVGAWASLLRQRDFAWATFKRIFRWALLAYIIEAGVIEFAFAKDHVRGSSLTLVTLMLVIFATSVPTAIAFTASRYADPAA